MPVTEDLTNKIKKDYNDRFGCQVTSVQDGAGNLFGGSLVIATYSASAGEIIKDVVYVDALGSPRIFESTQELILFLREKSRYNAFDALIESKMFHGIVFVLLLFGVIWAGWLGDRFDPRALAILGSVVGLAAGLFFGPGKK
jgi:MFS family permease